MQRQRKTVGYLVSHPIQYQAPLLRKIAKDSAIKLIVFFRSDVSTRAFKDPDFGKIIQWDVPLLDGYKYEFLPAFGKSDVISFLRPFNYGLVKRLKFHHVDALWVHGYMSWFHWVTIFMAKRLGIKVFVRDEATLISRQRGCFKRMVKRLFFYVLNRWCDGFLAIGSLNADYYRYNGISSKKIFLVPYAVDNEFFQEKATLAARNRENLRSELGLDTGRPVILYASKLSERKRPGDLLNAYIGLSPDGKSEPHPYLLFVGDGQMRALLEKRVKKTGWDSIKFLGFKGQMDLPSFYDLCDVFVLPSVHEPWGLVVNEAMNAGRAIIVSDQVGCGPDLVKNGINGYIYEAGNVNALSCALHAILENKEVSKEMGVKSLEIINGWDFEADIEGIRQCLRLA